MKGTRREFAEHESTLLAAGEYAKVGGEWYGCSPSGHVCWLKNHTVTEHEDRTITASPSILISTGAGPVWHGYLEHGIWRTC